MNRISRLALTAALAVATHGCSRGGGGSEQETLDLPAGVYTLGGITGRTDPHQLLRADGDLAASQVSVQVVGDPVQGFAFDAGGFTSLLDGVEVTTTLTGSTFEGDAGRVLDFSSGEVSDPPYDCVAGVEARIAGEIVGHGRAHVTFSGLIEADSGSQCAEAATWLTTAMLGGAPAPFPLTAEVSFDLTYSAPLPPPPPPPVTAATVTEFTGSGAVLAAETNSSPVTGTGSLDGTFGGENVTESGVVGCFAPGENFPTYGVVFVGPAFTLDLEIAPESWHPGVVSVDGSAVTLSMWANASPESAVPLFGGTLLLLTAPTLADDPASLCQVQLTAAASD